MSLSFYARDAGPSENARGGLDRYDAVLPRTATQEEKAAYDESLRAYKASIYVKDYPSTHDRDKALLVSLGVNGEVPLGQAWDTVLHARAANDNYEQSRMAA